MKFYKESMFDGSYKGSKFKNIHNGVTIQLIARGESMSSIGWECKHLDGQHKDAAFNFWVSDLSLRQSYEKI